MRSVLFKGVLSQCLSLEVLDLAGGRNCNGEDRIVVSSPSIQTLHLTGLSRLCRALSLEVCCGSLSMIEMPSHATAFSKILFETPRLSKFPLTASAERYFDEAAAGLWELSFHSQALEALPLTCLRSLRAYRSFRSIHFDCPSVTQISGGPSLDTIALGGGPPIAKACSLELKLPMLVRLSLIGMVAPWRVAFGLGGMQMMESLTLHEVTAPWMVLTLPVYLRHAI